MHAVNLPQVVQDMYSVTLAPVGLQREDAEPRNEQQAQHAAHCLLHGLAALHSVSDHVCHAALRPEPYELGVSAGRHPLCPTPTSWLLQFGKTLLQVLLQATLRKLSRGTDSHILFPGCLACRRDFVHRDLRWDNVACTVGEDSTADEDSSANENSTAGGNCFLLDLELCGVQASLTLASWLPGQMAYWQMASITLRHLMSEH